MPSPKVTAKGILEKIVDAHQGLPHLSAVAEEFIDLAGGPRAVAKMLWNEFSNSPPGGIVRQRLLDIITRVWKYGSDTVGKPHNPEEMSDQDLEAELAMMLQEVSDAQKPAAERNPAGRFRRTRDDAGFDEPPE